MVDDNSELRKAKGLNKNVEPQKVIMNIKMFCWIRNVWDIQWIGYKDHRIGTYEINKISLPCFDDKVYIQNSQWMKQLS